VYLKHAARPMSLQNLWFYCPVAQQGVATGNSFSPLVKHRTFLCSTER
jgi:hypothetical protein